MGIKVKKDSNSTAKKEILLSKENAKTIQLLEFEHFLLAIERKSPPKDYKKDYVYD